MSSQSEKKKYLITAALPYANGKAHIGHLLEYIQADIQVRTLRSMGHEAVFICSSDSHGTPIELNSLKKGIAPEEFIKDINRQQAEDFKKFGVAFDQFCLTHDDENKNRIYDFFEKIQAKGKFEEREINALWSEVDQRFLPDRFIKGTCPKCKTPDQYGDNCESCGATYEPKDLIDPKSVLSGDTPVIKKTKHLYYKLSSNDSISFLKDFLSQDILTKEQIPYVQGWIEGGLQDWCVTRDKPYFGFEVPGFEGKYFYVWMDAPIGYIAATEKWAKRHGKNGVDYWNDENTVIEHIIGKDIVYFHTLFWPALLKDAGYKLPSKVRVHGMLTANGVKLSKSRGTFINAGTFAKHLPTESLRYYFATKYDNTSGDIDWSVEDYVNKTNADLVNKYANLVSRSVSFLNKKIDGSLGELPFHLENNKIIPQVLNIPNANVDKIINDAQKVIVLIREVNEEFFNRQFAKGLRALNKIADIGNEFFQDAEPWNQLKENPELARLTCTFAINICEICLAFLQPIIPEFTEKGYSAIYFNKTDATNIANLIPFQLRTQKVGTMKPIFERITVEQVEGLMEETKKEQAHYLGATSSTLEKNPHLEPIKEEITFNEFMKTDLRVGKVVACENVPKSKKLLKFQVDCGEGQLRQIVSGIAQFYKAEELVGSEVMVVANLAVAKIMGIESQGMILSAEYKNEAGKTCLQIIAPPNVALGSTVG